MLKTVKKTVIEGQSIIDGDIVAGFRADITSDDPENMRMSVWQQNRELYKENRVQVRADQAEFEDKAYAFQEKLISENTNSETSDQ